MPPPTLSVTHPDLLGAWAAMIGFGAFHGLNPGMGWLFALSLGLQQQSKKAVFMALFPIVGGHLASIGLVALLVLLGRQLVSMETLELAAGLILVSFGIYKLFNYYRHPRWVGMRVGWRDLFLWSFLMASAHGAGLMIAPFILELTGFHGGPGAHGAHLGSLATVEVLAGLLLHMVAMFVVMGLVAWLVYSKLSLAVLRKRWINFDLIWAIALIAVGAIALISAVT